MTDLIQSLAAIEALAERASPAPWEYDSQPDGHYPDGRDLNIRVVDIDGDNDGRACDYGYVIAEIADSPKPEEDAALIVALRNLVPKLAALLETHVLVPREASDERLTAAVGEMVEAAGALADVFARDGENSLERFERLAAMFHRDTGYLAPGKDQPIGGADQPDGAELSAIYDAWFAAKVERVRKLLPPITETGE